MRKRKEYQEDVKKRYCSGQNLRQISEDLSICYKTINFILFEEYKLERRSKSGLCEKDIQSMIDLYQNENLTMQEISDKFNISRETLRTIFKNKFIKTKKRCDWTNFNHYFFKDGVIDQNTAYILGMWMADGYNGLNNRIAALTLHKKDEDIIFKISEILEYKGKIKLNETKNQYSIRLGSKYFCKDLDRLGCMQAKSLILSWPENIPSEYLNHFIRGYFDGDGSIYLNKNTNQYGITILGTKDFCENLNKQLSFLIGIKNIKIHPNKKTRIYRIGGNKQVKKLVEWLYKDATIYMNRKYEIAKKLMT